MFFNLSSTLYICSVHLLGQNHCISPYMYFSLSVFERHKHDGDFSMQKILWYCRLTLDRVLYRACEIHVYLHTIHGFNYDNLDPASRVPYGDHSVRPFDFICQEHTSISIHSGSFFLKLHPWSASSVGREFVLTLSKFSRLKVKENAIV